MVNILEILKHPWVMFWDFDRHRKFQPEIYGRYKPTFFKRLQCWILSERIEHIDWEEVPPYKADYDPSGEFIKPREGVYHPFECVSQPNMVSETHQLYRYAFALCVLYMFNRQISRDGTWFKKIHFFNNLYYFSPTSRVLICSWMTYIILRNYVNRNHYKPYN